MDIILCAVLFFAAIVTCVITGRSMAWALIVAFLALSCMGLRRGYKAPALFEMSKKNVPKAMIVVRVLCYIGLLTGLWRSAGTISFFIYYGIRVISPAMFLMIAFLLSLLLSFAIGTSFGVASTAGVVLMALARAGGVNEAVTAGVIMSGIYFGDRGAPTSSCASLVAALTETDLFGNVKRMLKTAALPLALTFGVYFLLSRANPITVIDEELLTLLRDSFGVSAWMVLPAVIMLTLPLFKVPIRRAMAVSIVAAFVLTVTMQDLHIAETVKIAIFGYHPENSALAQVMSGGGFVSMFPTMVMNVFAAACTGLLEGMGLLEGLRGRLTVMRDKIGLLPTLCLSGTGVIMCVCNQTIAIMMSHQLLGSIYEKEGKEHEEFAMDIANSIVTIAGLVPWSIACSVPLSMLGVGISALPYACYLYLLPICYLLTKRFFYPTKSAKNEANSK